MDDPKPQTKLDEVILAKAIADGYSKIDAYRLAGGQSENKGTAVRMVNDYLQKNPDVKVDIITQMEKRRQDIIESMDEDKATTMPYDKGMVAVGILTDKIQLLKGDPTERLEIMPRMIFKGGTSIPIRRNRPEIAEETNKQFEEENKDDKDENKNHPTND